MAMGSFSIEIGNFAKLSAEKARLVVQKIAMEAFKRVIEKSPVDTGRFRANWGCQVGSPYAGVSDSVDKSGGTTTAKVMGDVTAWNGIGSMFICNNLPYSIALEYGHSKQAPGGMVRLTIAELQSIIPQVVK